MALKSTAKLLLYSSSLTQTLRSRCRTSISAMPPTISRCYFVSTGNAQKKKKKAPQSSSSSLALVKEKRRTRSKKDFDKVAIQIEGATEGHIPVMLAEVMDVFATSSMRPLHSFVDCTLGAGGHSSAITQAHPELKFYMGMDVDPIALEKARSRVHFPVIGDSSNPTSDLNSHIFLKNYKYIKSLLGEADEKLLETGVDGILMDLGMSSMQVNNPERGFSVLSDGPLDMRMDPSASLTAEDILNTWPEKEVGRILKEYGEESNWRSLQNRIIKARSDGGLHSTSDLVQLIRSSTGLRQGRQGWIKTATRVFQGLRIAVNDELKTLEDTLSTCFDCLAPEGRLAVISFHSLEDRVVKRSFLDIIKGKGDGRDAYEEKWELDREKMSNGIEEEEEEEEGWIKQRVDGARGTILTKRPITPSEKEESSNRRSRSAKLRVIQKAR